MQTQTIEDLYREKSRLIFRYLLKIGCSKQDAEDIVQNSFSKAVEHMIHMEVANPSAWLFKVSINDYYNLCRKKKRYPNVQIDETFFENMHSTEEAGEQRLIRHENKQEIEAVLEQLPSAQSNLLLLKYELTLSYEEISDLLDVKVDTIRTTLYRSRKNFKQKWSEFIEKKG
ncbi:RNA polymerase sigma factor [Planococcus sp. ANT_H30]|uniref:RNA polymerase sigma factor n=1 Tax=Planococcus sp. ANT_H30 TaxID=2597347 RepID=UPI0011EBE0C8|nr:RNA polymerase sigma factor [Planococcus sp. ANT_H30]KAA0955347.1 RNA polymerase sigma factor [Planococcus sp. ANT_H30]